MYRIMSDTSRNSLKKCDKVSDIASGLANYSRIINHNY